MTNLEFNNAELKALDNAEMEETEGGNPVVVLVAGVLAVSFLAGVAEGMLEEYNKRH